MTSIVVALLSGFIIGVLLMSYLAARVIRQIRRQSSSELRRSFKVQLERLKDKQRLQRDNDALRQEVQEWKERAGLVNTAKAEWPEAL